MSVEMKVRRAGWDKRSSAEVRRELDRVLEEVEKEPSPLTPAVKHKRKKEKKVWYRCIVCSSPLERSNGVWADAKGGRCGNCGTREVKGSKPCPNCKRTNVLLMTDGTIICALALWFKRGCGYRGIPKKRAA